MKFNQFEFNGMELKLKGYLLKTFDVSTDYNILIMENSVNILKNTVKSSYGLKRALKHCYDIKLNFAIKGIIDCTIKYNEDGITGGLKISFYNLMQDNNFFIVL